MRIVPPVCSLFAFVLAATLSAAQLPEMRPALLGSGPNSLINLIDTQKLAKSGDAIVRFSCGVNYRGQGYDMVTYRGSANSKALSEELVEKVERATFVAPVHQHQNRWCILSGTAVLAVVNGKPHLRIFLNQEEEHLKRGDDFISPQPIFWEHDRFNGFDYPKHGDTSGDVGMALTIDANGNLKEAKITSETPAGLGFGPAVKDKINTVTFLPAYFHGKPVSSTTTTHFLFKGWGHGPQWRTDT